MQITKMIFEELLRIDREIFNNPELGYKEFKTRATIIEFLNKFCSGIKYKELSATGVRVEIGSGKKVGIVAELDAVYAPNHYTSVNGAAHNCGHHSQVVLALGMIKHFFDNQENLENCLVFIFTPAEEYLDLEYRKSLLKENKIKSVSGKVNMMLNHEVDDIDCFMHFHSMVEDFDYDINASLAGFDYIEVEITGKTAHAGAEPQKGINALDSVVRLYQFMREVEKASNDSIRINPIISNDGLLNIVVDKAVIKTYVRSFDYEQIKIFIKQISKQLEIEKQQYNIEYKLTKELGYSEFNQSNELNEIVKEVLASHKCRYDEKVYASGDIGDFGFLVPSIQIGYRGFVGHIHGDNFKNSDDKFIYETTLNNFIQIIEKIDKQVQNINLYKRTVEEYCKYKEI